MAGIHKGVQAEILRATHSRAVFSPCAAHSLNLCGSHAVRSITPSQKYFKNIQRLSYSVTVPPDGKRRRREDGKKNLSVTFKPQSETRFSERLDAIKPFPSNSQVWWQASRNFSKTSKHLSVMRQNQLPGIFFVIFLHLNWLYMGLFGIKWCRLFKESICSFSIVVYLSTSKFHWRIDQ